MSLEKTHYAITLLHGTFATDAPWTKGESTLCKTISTALKPDDVDFDHFNWSGANNHRERLASGEKFRSFLRLRMQRFPESHHFVIAHSHGGNIAMYALRDRKIAEAMSGLITMGTPFISSSNRDVDLGIDILRMTLAWNSMSLSAALTFLSFSLFYALIFGEHFQVDTASTGGAIAALTIYAVPIAVFILINGPIRRWVKNKQDAVAEKLKFGDYYALPMLCAFTSYDEANLHLIYIRKISNTASFLFKWISKILRPFLTPFLVTTVICIMISGALHHQQASSRFLKMAIMVFYVCYIVLALQALMVIVPAIIRSRCWGFGGESFTDNWFSDIVSTRFPPRYNCEKYGVQVTQSRLKIGLHHSVFYENVECVEKYGTWIRDIAKSNLTPPSKPAEA